MPTIADLRGGTGLPVALEDTEHSAFIEGDTWAIGPLTLQVQDGAGEWSASTCPARASRASSPTRRAASCS